ncbi:MAG: two-component system, OmpR family, sensor histidine kinase BaeS [Thermoanaerobaculia bacterium]|jgi:two-component system sensor histidine kinase BaeS|nr:two-component system, OmpR family, sensor histidine kinase BaeS [Thermoanaerobaculia bacterium]
MRIVTTLRGRLIAMVAALVAVTLGTAAIISTRVAHYEIRKFEVEVHAGRRAPMPNAIANYYRAHGSWAGVEPAVEAMSHAAGSNIALFDEHNHLAATSKALRGAAFDLAPNGMLTITRMMAGGRTRELIRGPQMIVRDPNGGIAGSIFVLPPHNDSLPQPTRSLDRSFFWIFLGATLFGIAMAIAIARWISVPVERLTDAARRMESGDLAVRVEPRGGAELAELARGFNAMAAALDRNEEQRKRMVSDVAHELRAPLTNIRCELESMQDGLTAPTPERIASLHEETMHLAHLVDDLQDLALAEAGRLEIDAQPVSVASLARRAATGMEMRARDRGVIIRCDGDDEIPVLADARRAVQVLTNLLANAVAHMEKPGDVRITWERSRSEAIIRVIDSGVGIPADELPHIFERFYRVDVSRSRSTGGAGLGLSIVRQLVAAHGGRVWAESEVGVGSTFSFTLPSFQS